MYKAESSKLLATSQAETAAALNDTAAAMQALSDAEVTKGRHHYF